MTPRLYFLYQTDLRAGRGNTVVGAVRLSWQGGPNQAVDHFLPKEYN